MSFKNESVDFQMEARELIDASNLVTRLFRWVYGKPGLFPLVPDGLFWLGGLAAAQALSVNLALFLIPIAVQALVGLSVGLYRGRWRASSFDEVLVMIEVWAVSLAALLVGAVLFGVAANELGALVAGSIFALLGMGFSRVVWRRWCEHYRRPDSAAAMRVVVIGAGEGANQIVKAMLADPNSPYYPVALLDDNPQLMSRQIGNVRVAGTRDDLAAVSAELGAKAALVAIPGASSALIREMSVLADSAGLELLVVPPISEVVGDYRTSDVRVPTADDLLGREPVEIDLTLSASYLTGKRVLVTGAGGSIGSELSRHVGLFEPSRLYFLDRDETALHGLQLSIEGRALLDSDQLVVADIRDRERIFELFEEIQPDVVFHAAALKHLTLLESHPMEGVKTNTIGTMNLLDAAKWIGVERFVNVSTDKAADPSSMLGATKLAAERLTAQAALETGAPYLSVRFGNVLGSRGSVLPTFLDQLQSGGPLTVTDAEATRFFMTIPEACRLVIQAGAIGESGEVLVLDMGEPVKILDLATSLIQHVRPGTRIEFTGLRAGEKLHEILVAEVEQGSARVHPRIMHIKTEVLDPLAALSLLNSENVERTNKLMAQSEAPSPT